jgi:CRP-like cAMP-binding protein
MDAREILKSTPFFAEVLDDRELALLADRAREVAFNPGETLMEEDQPASSMFVLVTGDVRVNVKDEADPVAKVGAGAIVGEISLLTGESRTATVTAVTPVSGIEVDKDALANVLWMSHDLVDRFVEMLFRRQRELDKAHGGNAWGMMRPGKAEIAEKIRAFFEKTTAEGSDPLPAAKEVPGAEQAVEAALGSPKT